MNENQKNNSGQSGDGIMKDLMSLSDNLARQKYPGNAWQDAMAKRASEKASGGRRILRLVLPALTAAAAVIFIAVGISHILNPKIVPTRISVSQPPQPEQEDEEFFLTIPAAPEISVGDRLEMASTRDLPAPDTTMLPDNVSLRFAVPEISMPTAASAGVEWKTPSLTMPSFKRS